MKNKLYAAVSAAVFVIFIIQISCSGTQEKKELTEKELVELGEYIVNSSGCDDCHTPKVFTANGMEPDMSKRFSGFPEGEKLPPLDLKTVAPGNWYAADKHLAAWVGPWGISFASNITPDKATGIGTLTEDMFIKAIREGKLMGVGRSLLPPMPWQPFSKKTDTDLKAIYAYLMSLKPVSNQVPQPVPPDKMKDVLAAK